MIVIIVILLFLEFHFTDRPVSHNQDEHGGYWMVVLVFMFMLTMRHMPLRPRHLLLLVNKTVWVYKK
jgi:hypothetical protein